MGKKNRKHSTEQQKQPKDEGVTTLKDILNPDMLEKLKAQSKQLQAEEVKRKEDERLAAEEKRKQEQKRLENDFEYLLTHSELDWKKYK